MADVSHYLAILDGDPDDAAVVRGLATALAGVPSDRVAETAAALARSRKTLRERGRFDAVVHLLELELAAPALVASTDRRADLLLEKAAVYFDDLLDEAQAAAAFRQVLEARPGDEAATDGLQEIEEAQANWGKFADKYVGEARASTDRQLATQLYLAASETVGRHAPGHPDVEQHLRAALEVEPRNRRAAVHLERVLGRGQRWAALVELLGQRADLAGASRDERVAALVSLSEVARAQLADADVATSALARAIAIDPGHPAAVRQLADLYAAGEKWRELAALYQGAMKARPGGAEDVGLGLQVGMILWKHLGELDAAEEFLRRVRKGDPTHPAVLDFYRAYYPARGEGAKLVALLRQAEAAVPAGDSRQRAFALEIAELAEAQLGNPEKAIEAWKQLLRAEPTSVEARAALARLYRKSEKWNALLDLRKEDEARLAETDVAGRVAILFDILEIYRDRLKLDGMVLSTYNTLLKLEPDNRRALDELAEKFRQMSRWNDLIALLTRKAEVGTLGGAERIGLLREVASLWIDRFGNFAQAVRPLEQILELAPGDVDAVTRLKDIYTRRRQWRALIALLGKEAEQLGPDERRVKQAEMARLAMERVGDQRYAIEIWNQVLADAARRGGDDPGLGDTLAALAGLYEREKRHLAHVEILRRQRRRAATPAEAIALLEKIGAILADRVGAPAQAASVWQEILGLDPNHGKALRTLRELLAAARDWDGLEALYARLGHEDELVEALMAIADRTDDRAARAALYERAATAAQRRGGDGGGSERSTRVWERLIAVEPTHLRAARELIPHYLGHDKFAKVLPLYEVVLGHASTDPERLAVMADIRALCEHKLGSKGLAHAWTGRAIALAPTDPALRRDLLRLGRDPEHVGTTVTVLEQLTEHPDMIAAAPAAQIELLRDLASLYERDRKDPERARAAWRRVLVLAPEDADAVRRIEALSTELADWPALIASMRQRAQVAPDDHTRVALLVEIATAEEQRLADLDAAAATYQDVLARDPGHRAAARSLARLAEARGDWDGVVSALDLELASASTDAERARLHLRIAQVQATAGPDSDAALGRLLAAFALTTTADAGAGGSRDQAYAGLRRALEPGAAVTPARVLEIADAVAGPAAARGDFWAEARALELRRPTLPAGAAALGCDRRLLELYQGELFDDAQAHAAGLRVLAAAPADGAVRSSLFGLAERLGRDGELAGALGAALAALRADPAAAASDRRAVATELAMLAGERLRDAALAERAWLAVLEVEPAAPDALAALAALYRAGARTGDLRALLERWSQVAVDDPVRIRVLTEAAALDEELGDPARAAGVHRQLLTLDPTALASYQALDAYLTARADWAGLDDLLASQLGHQVGDVDALTVRRAELAAHHLQAPDRAVDLLEEAVARRPGNADARELLEELLADPTHGLRVANLLEPLYQRDGLWKDLAGVLRRQAASAGGPAEAFELAVRIAGLEEARLEQPRAAFDSWLGAFGLDPTDGRPRAALAGLAATQARWPEVARAYEAALGGDLGSGDRAALLAELAELYDTQLDDADGAIRTYRRLVDADPTSPDTVRRAGAALARLFEEEESWPELRDVVRRQAEWADDATARRQALCRVALLEEERLGDLDAAIAAWRQVLADDPDHAEAHAALDRLLTTRGRWPELIDLIRQGLDRAEPAAAKASLLRIAQLQEQRLAAPGEAVAALREVLDRDGDDDHALAELARLVRAADRPSELLEVLERRLSLGQVDAIATEVEIATLLEGPLGRPSEALDRWASVLRRSPDRADARAAIERAVADPGLRPRAAELLHELFAATGDDLAATTLHLQLADLAGDPAEAAPHLRAVMRLREQRLGDKAGALAVGLRAVAGSATDPELPALLAATDRLAAELGREGDLIDVYRQVAPEVLDADLQRRMYLDVADLARGVRGDNALAREHYQRVLDASPDDPRALAALESLARVDGDPRALWELLQRKAELSGDVDEQVEALAEAAALAAGPLGRSDDAITGWERVLDLAPERPDAVAALDTLYRGAARWHELRELYERRLGFVVSIDEAVALRLALAELHRERLLDTEGAIEHYAAALGGDADQPRALAALEELLLDPQAQASAAEVLEPMFIAAQDWRKLVHVYQVKLDSAAEPAERVRLTRFVARLYEEQLEDFEQASAWYARLFREDPADASVRDQLQRLAGVVDNWGFVADTYQRFVDAGEGDADDLRAVALALAGVSERRLADLPRAAAALRRALAARSDDTRAEDREILRQLESVLIRAGDYRALVDVYDDAILASDDDATRRDLVIKRARVLERELAEPDRALAGWRDALDLAGGDDVRAREAYGLAADEIERLLGAREAWRDVVELLRARIERTTDESEVVTLRLRMAGLLEQVGDVQAAVDEYEEVLAAPRGGDRGLPALERLVVRDDLRERVSGLLEPLYRQRDWWQKLVVILDAKLAFVSDVDGRVATLREIARLHDQRGGDPDLALSALARAWREDVADPEVRAELVQLATRLAAWNDLVDVLAEGVGLAGAGAAGGAGAAADPDLVAEVGTQVAELHEHRRGDVGAAITAWRQVLVARPDDVAALAALDRLLAVAGRPAELVAVIERRAELVEDAGVRLVLLHRAAAMYEEVLADPTRAVAAYRSVLAVDDSDVLALDGLVRLHHQQRQPRDLADVVRRKIELASAGAERRGLRLALAEVHERELADPYEAITQLQAVLEEGDGRDDEALAGLERIHQATRMWPELLEVLDRRAALAAAPSARIGFLLRAADLADRELADGEQAIDRLGQALALAPADPGAHAAVRLLAERDDLAVSATALLEQAARSQRDSATLIWVFERRLRLSTLVGDERREAWAELAEVHETLAGDARAAWSTWVRAFGDLTPVELELLTPLTRLAGALGTWSELATILDQRLADCRDPDVEFALAMALGGLREDRLGDLPGAATAFARAEASHVDDPAALAAQARVLARAGSWASLVEVLGRQAEAAADDAGAAEFLYRAGDLRESTLRDVPGAVAAYRDTLSRAPRHAGARAALARQLAGGEEVAAVADVLEPLYEDEQDWVRLYDVVAARLAITPDRLDRAALCQRLVEIADRRIADRARALSAALAWLAADPASRDAFAEAERLAAARGAWADLVTQAEPLVDQLGDAQTQVGLLLDLGRVQLEHLRAPSAAASLFTRALALDPDCMPAIEGAASAYRALGDHARLADLEWRRGQLASDPALRRVAFTEVGELREQVGDDVGAAQAWEAVLEVDDADRFALDRLARVYERRGDRAALVDVLARTAAVSRDPGEERALRVRLATLEDSGADPAAAVRAWQAVVDVAPDDDQALTALEAAHQRVGDLRAVADVIGRRLDLASGTAARIALMARLARLAEQQGQPDEAVAQWFAVIDADGRELTAFAELERLLGEQKRWHDLVEVLARRAESEALVGNAADELRALARAADVWEVPLDDADAARELLEKILARDPASVVALTRLSRIYERGSDWERCSQVLQRALAMGPTGRDAADLFFRLAQVAQRGDGDAATAQAHLRQALVHDRTHAEALAALEALARERGDGALLVDALRRRLDIVAGADRRPVLLELAELERKAGQPASALPLLEEADRGSPGDPTVLAPLADAYVAAGQLDRAAPILEKLADEARAARRMKDVARYRQRQGAILEARGDGPGALVAYEEAFRVNPTDVATMAGLGRLYMHARDWDKARRVYRSLVLQTIDADAGVSKGDVYLALGVIHVELGEAPKARGMYQRGLELEPGHDGLRQALAALG